MNKNAKQISVNYVLNLKGHRPKANLSWEGNIAIRHTSLNLAER